MNPNPARISAVIINARVSTSFTARSGQVVTAYSEEGNILTHRRAYNTGNLRGVHLHLHEFRNEYLYISHKTEIL